MKNVVVKKVIKIVEVLAREKYINEYSEEDINKIVKLSTNCLSAILEDDIVDFKIVYDSWEDFSVRVSAINKVDNKTLFFDAEISFVDDTVLTIEYTDKVLVNGTEIENKTVNVNYDILKYLLNE